MKKNFLRQVATIVALATLTIGFSACSSDSDTPQPNDPNQPNDPGVGSEAVELSHLLLAVYRTDNSAGIGNYELQIGSAETMEWEGDTHLFLDLYHELDADPLNPVLPNGTYEASAEILPGTFQAENSSLQVLVDGAIEATPVMGTVTVSRTGGQYTIHAKVSTMWDESELEFYYEGPIQFVQGGTSAFLPFEEEQQITFEESQGRYWGNWFRPYSDDFMLEFFSGEFNENGTLTKGYYLKLGNIYMPKAEDYNLNPMPIAPGTYMVYEKAPLVSTLTMPFKMDQGAILEYWGDTSFAGSYLQYIDEDTKEKRIGLIHSGSLTVASEGQNYTMTFDFQTEEGISVKGTYTGEVNFPNLNDNDQNNIWADRPWTTLTEDHTYNIPEGAVSYAFLLGDYIQDGLDVWQFNIMAMDQNGEAYGDYFTTELMVDVANGVEIPQGTFEVSWEVKPNVMVPGVYTAGNVPQFTFYGDLTLDEEGYSAALAAIKAGTLTISKEADENYRFVFDLVDDGDHKITGEWSGAVVMEDFRDDMEQGGDDDGGHDHEHSFALRARR